MGLPEALGLVAIPLKMLAVAVLLSVVANRLVEGLVKPLYVRREWDKFSLMYVAWGFGALLTGLGEVNLFVDVFPMLAWGFIPGQIIGIALSALVAGGGANLIHDIFGSLSKKE
jgi:hypothetical protein